MNVVTRVAVELDNSYAMYLNPEYYKDKFMLVLGQ